MIPVLKFCTRTLGFELVLPDSFPCEPDLAGHEILLRFTRVHILSEPLTMAAT